MQRKLLATCTGIFFLLNTYAGDTLHLNSPSKMLALQVYTNDVGTPCYKLFRKGVVVVRESPLGIQLKDREDLIENFSISGSMQGISDTVWETVWGEEQFIRDHHTFLVVDLKQKGTNIILQLEWRLFDDGLGFRYIFPEQADLKSMIVSGEQTTFSLTGDHLAWWIPGDYDTNEYTYSTTALSKVDAIQASEGHPEIATRTAIAKNVVQSPLMLKTEAGLYLHIFEAALINYPAMHLEIDAGAHTLRSKLVPDAVGNMAYLSAPCKTPWRTIIVSDKATDILNSNIILNLNLPCALDNTEWITPMKYVGIWWEMHVGTASWEYAQERTIDLTTTDWNTLTPNGHHGATTERTKYYIDFAAAHGFDGVLVEGWNVGWEDWFGNWKENVFDFVTPYPDFNVAEIQQYAASKNVKMIMHHETSASVTNYERRLQEAMRFMTDHDYPAVKTGYVGRIIPRGEWHDGQWMVNHYVYVAQQMAKNKLMVDAHEPVRPTGLHRTYPNWLACEAARGNEFNAWSKGNPPEHETILPFTRLMGGPMDYTPGIFQIKMSAYGQTTGNQVHTTLAKQLALYVTMYSPLQMAADIPENYLKYADAFQFIQDVPVDWQQSIYLEAEPGDHVTVARKQKNNNSWFVGAITDENARLATVSLDFLDQGTVYTATIYADAPDAHWEKNPQAYQISSAQVKKGSTISVNLAPGGGAAISLVPVAEN